MKMFLLAFMSCMSNEENIDTLMLNNLILCDVPRGCK